MVAPHPHLHTKIRNTRRLVTQNKAHLIPGLAQRSPDQYVSHEKVSVFDALKPWIESTKPKNKKLLGLGTGIETLASATVRDRVLVLYVDFDDQPAQITTAAIYERFFSLMGKSLTTYYTQNSYGKYIPVGEVHGPYRAPQPLSYYVDNQSSFGTYPANMQKLVEDTITLAVADPAINWLSFDNSGNQTIDYLIIVHAGAEAAYTGNLTDIWAHASQIIPMIRNGVGFQYYATVSEYMATPADAPRTGVDSHEFGHLLGLPDLYDYSENGNGAGNYSIMAHGNWMDDGITPVHLDAWSKYFCEFSNTFVDQPGLLLINDAETHNVNYLFTTKNVNEYFMVENRQNAGFDEFLPANGLLIWKVNVSQPYNNNKLCYKVALVQADGQNHLENSVNFGDSSDSYPGTSNNRAIGLTTLPSTVLCDGSFPVVTIGSIADSGNVMSFMAELCTSTNPVVGLTIL